MALGTTQRQTQEDNARGGHAIDHPFDAELLGIVSPLRIEQRIAMKAGGYLLLDCGARQEVAGKLLDHELVEGEIAIEGADHPVPVLPYRSGTVGIVSVG